MIGQYDLIFIYLLNLHCGKASGEESHSRVMKVLE